MKYDYTAICNCRWESYHQSLKDARGDSKAHVEACDHEKPEVYIDRNADFGSGMEIDDRFKSIVIIPKGKVASATNANDFLQRYFFG